MAIAKYSPTVFFAYKQDRDWFKKNGGGFDNGKNKNKEFDDDGFDKYGYNENEKDREGYTEEDYLNDMFFEGNEIHYILFEKVEEKWRNKKII